MGATPLPGGSGFLDNGNGTGDFTFIPPGPAGTMYTVTFSADDGVNPPVTQDVDINVVAPNGPPILAAISDDAIVQGASSTFQISATDPESDAISFSVTPAIANVTLVDNGNGTADFDFTPAYSQGVIVRPCGRMVLASPQA